MANEHINSQSFAFDRKRVIFIKSNEKINTYIENKHEQDVRAEGETEIIMPVPLLEIQPSQSSTANVSLSRRSFGSPLYERQTKTHQQQVINGPLPPESPLSLLSPSLSPSYSSSEVLPAGSSRWSPPTGLAPFHQTEGESSGFPPPWGPKNAPSSGRGRGKRGWMDEESEGGRREEEEGGGGGGHPPVAVHLLQSAFWKAPIEQRIHPSASPTTFQFNHLLYIFESAALFFNDL